jgi:hypothetical protein
MGGLLLGVPPYRCTDPGGGGGSAGSSSAGSGSGGSSAGEPSTGGTEAGGTTAGTESGGTEAGGTTAGTESGGTEAGGTTAGTESGGTEAGGTTAGTESGGTEAGGTTAGTESGGTAAGGTTAGTESGGTAAGGTTAGSGGVAGSAGHGTGYDVSDPSAVKDNQTGLVWQQLADGSYPSLNWTDADAYCTDLEHAGFDDWRMPSAYELFKLVRLDHAGSNHHDLSLFPNSPGDFFWTNGTTNLYGPEWRLTLTFGSYVAPAPFSGPSQPLLADLMEFEHRVRCVRAGEAPPPRFTDFEDGTVLDDLTGLVWEQLLTFDSTLSEAVDRCSNLTLAGGGWRLPTVVELMSVLPSDAPLETANSDGTPLWTASALAETPAGQAGGWVLFEEEGTPVGLYGMDFEILAKNRCVR